MAEQQLTEGQKKDLGDYQSLQQQMQMLMMQKQQLAVAQAENKAAVEAVEKAEGKVYRFAGSVLVEKDKTALKEELDNAAETLELRAKVIDKQEKQARERLAALVKKLETEFGGAKGE